MSDDFPYKPRHGFDIRVKQSKGGRTAAKKWVKQEPRKCDAPDCQAVAEARAPKSPQQMNEFYWFCPQHAREHNKNWNFFDAMSDEEAQKFREAQRYGGRPTWQMSKNGRAAAASRASADDAAVIDENIGIFAQSPLARKNMDGVFREGRKLTKLQVQAFKTLNLPANAPENDIRKRYAELVKRFHPDSNAGDRGAEEQLQEVIKAHQILKKAGYC